MLGANQHLQLEAVAPKPPLDELGHAILVGDGGHREGPSTPHMHNESFLCSGMQVFHQACRGVCLVEGVTSVVKGSERNPKGQRTRR